MPGLPTGTLSVKRYTAYEDANLVVRVGGDRPGQDFGMLQATEYARPPALVTVESLNNFVPRLNQTFDVLTYTTRLMPSTDFPTLVSSQPAWASFNAHTSGSSLRIQEGVRNPTAVLSARFTYPIVFDSATAANNALDLLVANRTQTSASLKAITVTLPVSYTYVSGSVSGATSSSPNIATIGNRQQLSWLLNASIAAQGRITVSLGITTSSTPFAFAQSADVAVQVVSGVSVAELHAAPVLVLPRPLSPNNAIVTTGGGTLSNLNGLPLLTMRRADAYKPFLIRAHPLCPVGLSCGDPVSVSVNVLGTDYPMTPGAPPTLPLTSLISPQLPVPEWHHWIPGLSCLQQLPDVYCQPQPGPCQTHFGCC